MAGTILFRSFGFKIDGLKAGQAVLSEKANEEGPKLIGLLAGVFDDMDVKIDHSKAGAMTSENNRDRIWIFWERRAGSSRLLTLL